MTEVALLLLRRLGISHAGIYLAVRSLSYAGRNLILAGGCVLQGRSGTQSDVMDDFSGADEPIDVQAGSRRFAYSGSAEGSSWRTGSHKTVIRVALLIILLTRVS